MASRRPGTESAGDVRADGVSVRVAEQIRQRIDRNALLSNLEVQCSITSGTMPHVGDSLAFTNHFALFYQRPVEKGVGCQQGLIVHENDHVSV
ncbi:hypothetical protein D3C72_1911860 [compost metagenome]